MLRLPAATAALLVPFLLGCPHASPQPETTAQVEPSGAEDAGLPSVADGGDDEPAAEEGTPAVAGGCTTTADCPADHVCEGEGCGPGEGTCAPTDRMCTRDSRPYCGCDGTTFRGSGSCPGGRYAHAGPCEDDGGAI